MPMPSVDFSVFGGEELVTYSPLTGPEIEDVPTSADLLRNRVSAMWNATSNSR